MTNLMIIAHSAVAEGIYTEDEVKAIFESGCSLPLHTFKEWQRLGYQVRKGEHASLTCDIWRHKNKKVKQEEQSGEEVDESYFYKHKAFFFTDKQVDRIAK